MNNDIRTHKEINGRDPKPGYEWDAGVIPATAGRLGGRITVRLTVSNWEVVHVTFMPDLTNRTYVLETFDPDEDGERAAKGRAKEIYAERSSQTTA